MNTSPNTSGTCNASTFLFNSTKPNHESNAKKGCWSKPLRLIPLEGKGKKSFPEQAGNLVKYVYGKNVITVF